MKIKFIHQIITILFTIMIATALTACGGSSDQTSPETSTTVEVPTEITFGVPFEFNGLEITFNDSVSFFILENERIEYNGAEIIRIPISITNTTRNKLGFPHLDVETYGPNGMQSPETINYYSDGDIFMNYDLIPSGETIDSYIHILYSGDGDYYVEFYKSFSEYIEVKLPIDKPY